MPEPRSVHRARALGALACAISFFSAVPALAEDHYGSLLFQNDAFVGHDGGGYTNGVYFSSIRVASAGESHVAPGAVIGPVA